MYYLINITFVFYDVFKFDNIVYSKFLIVLSIVFLACKGNKKNLVGTTTYTIKKEIETELYDFSNPKKISLNSILREISGLSFENGAIYTHNDENGIVFEINLKNGQITSKERIGENADYEGIEIVGDTIILIESNGQLSFYNQQKKRINTIKTAFKQHNNVEGLCLNLQNKNELLIACKGQMLKDDRKNKAKAIYSYRLDTQKLDVNPFIIVSDAKLTKFLENLLRNEDISKKKHKKLINRVINFAPSGIAVHPRTYEFYIISAKGNLLVILDKEKKIKNIIFLDKKQLPQPEGICFDNNEVLYISTETKGDEGRIYSYEPTNQL